MHKTILGDIMDEWQEEAINYEGNIALRCGRQCGKSEAISEKAFQTATKTPGIQILVIAASQRQAGELFYKTKSKLDILHKNKLDEWQNKNPNATKEEKKQAEYTEGLYSKIPTLTKIELRNGAVIRCLPVGKTGLFIRGFTVDILIADEAAFIPEAVWSAVLPMIAVSQTKKGMGYIVLISTPFGKGGYFYNSCHDPGFKQIHVSSEDCPRIKKDFLLKEKKRLSKAEYQQEYLAEFVDDFAQLFPTDLIKNRMTFISDNMNGRKHGNFYLGVDIARYGEDENAFVFAEITDDKKVRIFKTETTEKKNTVDTINRIIKFNQEFKFRKIFIDDTGVGGGVTDALQEKLGKHRIVPLNNACKSENGKILKEDMYSNALLLMEKSEIDIISNLDLLRSLKSMTYEYTDNKHIKIFGNYSHLAEAFVRACWCVKEKGLKLFLF